ncbi:GFA family protein [Curvivirga sp.]|uniref:GFA family protein n=1 Tax=Curvivirga sp. TaxID=2856848 RepID=UPI003B5AE0EC
MIKGRCECGKVSFQTEKVRETVTVCHCSQCRRMSGHLWASTHAASYDDLNFHTDEGLEWYVSSDFAKRGFCKFCGSSLFYRMNDEEGVGIAAGCLDNPTNIQINKHIFVKDKGDYYEISDDLEQLETH